MKRNAFSSHQRSGTVFMLLLSMLLAAWAPLVSAANEEGSRGAAIAHACVTCHGPEGQSSGAIPSLQGISAQTLRVTLLAFRSGERAGTVMNRLARGLDDADIEAVSVYFSALPRR